METVYNFKHWDCPETIVPVVIKGIESSIVAGAPQPVALNESCRAKWSVGSSIVRSQSASRLQ